MRGSASVTHDDDLAGEAAVEAEDVATARLFIESAGIIVATPHATTLYDERGARYDIPKWVMADPDNLMPEPKSTSGGGGGGGGAEGGGAGGGAGVGGGRGATSR